MSHRSLASIAVALAVLVLLFAQTPASAQTAPAANTTKAYTPAKTPDGHPDMQGYWTNNTVTPLERPKGLGAKEFYTEAELTELMAKEKNRVTSTKRTAARPNREPTRMCITTSPSSSWTAARPRQSWNRRTSLIVGEKGTVPAMLPEARKRNAEIAAKNRGHEFDGPENRPLSARCIVLGQESVPMLPGGYNNNLQIVQGAGVVAIMHEMDHSVRVIPIDGRPHPPADITSMERRLARPLGGQHAGGGLHQLHRSQPVPRIRR